VIQQEFKKKKSGRGPSKEDVNISPFKNLKETWWGEIRAIGINTPQRESTETKKEESVEGNSYLSLKVRWDQPGDQREKDWGRKGASNGIM